MLDRLTKEEQLSFLQLMVFIAKADGVISDEEAKFLDAHSKRLNIDWRSLDGQSDIKDVLSPVVQFASKMIILMELIKLSFADGMYSKDEQKGVKLIGEILRVPPGHVDLIENWVVRGIKWAKDGEALLEPPTMKE